MIQFAHCFLQIVKFSKNGQFLSEFGQSIVNYNRPAPLGQFSLPHDIALDEEGDRLFVADRENGRVQVFSMSTGNPLSEIRKSEFFPTVYSVHYQPSNSFEALRSNSKFIKVWACSLYPAHPPTIARAKPKKLMFTCPRI